MIKFLAYCAGFVATFILFCLLLAWPFGAMWNYAVVQAVTVAQPIEYWPAFWLMMFIGLFIAGSRSSSSR